MIPVCFCISVSVSASVPGLSSVESIGNSRHKKLDTVWLGPIREKAEKELDKCFPSVLL